MRTVALRSVDPIVVDDPAYIVGRAHVYAVSPALPTEQVLVNAVYFDPGTRFRPHRHDFDQILYYESGTGVVALDGGDDVVVPAGRCVVLPAGVVHMHGCTADGPAMHLSIMVDTTSDFDPPYPASWERWRA
jgi:quercetin dioxygenase-like cupin family protein